MVTLLKKSRIGLVALGAMALMAIAGWQFGTNGMQEEFSGKEVAMENAIAGSGGGTCFQRMVICNNHYTVHHCDKKFTNTTCGTYEMGCLKC